MENTFLLATLCVNTVQSECWKEDNSDVKFCKIMNDLEKYIEYNSLQFQYDMKHQIKLN